MRLRSVDPRSIIIPAVRVSMQMEPEALESLRDSVAAVGVLEPPLVMDTGTALVLVDGKHRLEEAIAAGAKTIQVAVREGDETEAALHNLITSVARGKPRVADLVRVIGDLYTTRHVAIEELAKRTGLSRDYVERLITICEAGPELVEPLDAGLMGIGHAYLIARVADPNVRSRMVHQQLTYHFTVDRLRDHIKTTAEIAEEPVVVPPLAAPVAPQLTTCAGCGQAFGPQDIAPQPICRGCDGALWTARQQAAAKDGVR